MEQIQLLHVDDSLVLCVKPVGVLSQARKPGEGSMVSKLEVQLGGDIYPIHRLDLEVGGLMVYARTKSAAGELSRQLQQGQLKKEYLAVLTGSPTEPEGLLEDLLFYDRSRNKTYVVKRKRKGVREALLRYRTLDFLEGRTLVQVRLLTGRTHQIRAQFASRGLPLEGDGRYGGGGGKPQLWSMALTMAVPGQGQIRYTALPEKLGPFTALLEPPPLL